MKTFSVLLIALFVPVGCSDASPHNSAASPNEFDHAIETIATSTNIDSVREADAKLRGGGIAAIDSLQKCLADPRIPASKYLTRAVSGTPDISDHAFWLIQDMIETPTPKLYSGEHSVLTAANVKKWLGDREGNSLRKIRIDAVTTSYENAKKDYETNGAKYTQDAMALYRGRLNELENESKQR